MKTISSKKIILSLDELKRKSLFWILASVFHFWYLANIFEFQIKIFPNPKELLNDYLLDMILMKINLINWSNKLYSMNMEPL